MSPYIHLMLLFFQSSGIACNQFGSFQGDASVLVLSFYVLVFKFFVLLAPYVCFHIIS